MTIRKNVAALTALAIFAAFSSLAATAAERFTMPPQYPQLTMPLVGTAPTKSYPGPLATPGWATPNTKNAKARAAAVALARSMKPTDVVYLGEYGTDKLGGFKAYFKGVWVRPDLLKAPLFYPIGFLGVDGDTVENLTWRVSKKLPTAKAYVVGVGWENVRSGGKPGDIAKKAEVLKDYILSRNPTSNVIFMTTPNNKKFASALAKTNSLLKDMVRKSDSRVSIVDWPTTSFYPGKPNEKLYVPDVGNTMPNSTLLFTGMFLGQYLTQVALPRFYGGNIPLGA